MSEKIKVLMTWDIKPEQESNTLEFMAHELAPAIQQMGITPTEAWYTVFGDCPQIQVGAVANDLNKMREVLESGKWQELMEKLSAFVSNFEQKLVSAKGRLQL